MKKNGFGIKALALSSVLLVGGCANGKTAQENIHTHRERTTVVQEDALNENDFAQIVALIGQSESRAEPTSAQDRIAQRGDLDVLFETCPHMFEKATPQQQERITKAVKSLFENNSFASDYASQKLTSPLCGVDIPTGLGRN